MENLPKENTTEPEKWKELPESRKSELLDGFLKVYPDYTGSIYYVFLSVSEYRQKEWSDGKMYDDLRADLNKYKDKTFVERYHMPERPNGYVVGVKDGGPMLMEYLIRDYFLKMTCVKLRNGTWVDEMLGEPMTGYAHHDNGDFSKSGSGGWDLGESAAK